MKFKLIITILLMLLLIETAAAVGYHWIENSTIVNGVTSLSQPTTGYINGVYYLIDGTTGYMWNGSGWESNTTIVSGLISPPPATSFYNTMYEKDSLWTLVSLAQYNGYSPYPDYGYTWNGSGWESNSSIINGLSDIVGSCCQYRVSSSFSTIYYGNVWNGIIGRGYIIPANGYYYGFNYGTSFDYVNNKWVSNTTLHNGLLPEGYGTGTYSTTGYPTPRTAIIVYNNTMYMIMGYTGGFTTPYGYIWNNITSNWDSSGSMTAGLSGKTHFTSFEMDGIPRLIGCIGGICSGYDLLNNSVPTIPNISSPINNSVQQAFNANITWNQSTDADSDTITYEWQISSNPNFSTISYTGVISNNYTGAVIGTNGSYWARVRSYDTVDYSNWSNSVYFTAHVITRYVNTTGWWSDINPFNSSSTPIANAVSNSSIGDTVYVYNGSYTDGSMTISISNFTLQGESSNLVNLTGKLIISGNSVNVTGFNMTVATAITISVTGSYANISYNKLENTANTFPYYFVLSVGSTSGYSTFINNSIIKVKYAILNSGIHSEFINNTISGSTSYGVQVSGIAGNLGGQFGKFVGGSIDTSGTYDYYCGPNDACGYCGCINCSGTIDNGMYFEDTNFTSRKVYLAASRIFNMSNNSIGVWTVPSSIGTGTRIFTRTLYNTTQSNVTWLDDQSNYFAYKIRGLYTSTGYTLYKGGVKNSVYITDSTGELSYIVNELNPVTLSLVKKEASVNNISLSDSVVLGGLVPLNIDANITINDNANISSATVRVLDPNSSYTNYTMSLVSDDLWRASISAGILLLGNYSTSNFYLTDEDGVSYNMSGVSTAGTLPGISEGGGAVPYVPYTTPEPTATPSETTIPIPTPEQPIILTDLLLSNVDVTGFMGGFQNQSDESLKDVLDCSKRSLIFDSRCRESTITIIEPINWWLLTGAFISPFIVMIILRRKLNLLNAAIYGTVTIIIIQVIVVFIGFNMYIFNYIIETTESKYMFLSYMMWSGIITLISSIKNSKFINFAENKRYKLVNIT